MNEWRVYNVVLNGILALIVHENLCCRNDYGVECKRNNVCLLTVTVKVNLFTYLESLHTSSRATRIRCICWLQIVFSIALIHNDIAVVACVL